MCNCNETTNTLQKEYMSRKITLFYELQANRKQQQATKEHYHPGIVNYTLPCIKICFISANLNLYFDASRLAVSQCQQCRPQELSLSPLYQNGKWFWSNFFLLLFRVRTVATGHILRHGGFQSLVFG